MCNLYHQATSVGEVSRFFKDSQLTLSKASQKLNIEDGYVGADQDGPVLVNGPETENTLEVSTKRWGFPSVQDGAKPITNIRNLKSSWWTGINGNYIEKPEFRCLVPFSRFAEWDASKKGNAWFEIDAPQAFFAGVWRPWNGERLAPVEGKKRRSRQVMNWELFAFLTTMPNEVVAPIHPKAMPVILTKPDECLKWMAGGLDSLALQRPLPADMTILSESNKS